MLLTIAASWLCVVTWLVVDVTKITTELREKKKRIINPCSFATREAKPQRSGCFQSARNLYFNFLVAPILIALGGNLRPGALFSLAGVGRLFLTNRITGRRRLPIWHIRPAYGGLFGCGNRGDGAHHRHIGALLIITSIACDIIGWLSRIQPEPQPIGKPAQIAR